MEDSEDDYSDASDSNLTDDLLSKKLTGKSRWTKHEVCI